MRSEKMCKLLAYRQKLVDTLKILKKEDIVDLNSYQQISSHLLIIKELIREQNIRDNICYQIKGVR